MLLKKHKSKVFIGLQGKDQEDAGVIAIFTDRIPSVLIVRWFDLFCFGFAMCSYVLDFFSDIGIAIMHFMAGRVLSGVLILSFALIPSLIINVISLIWMLDDEKHWKSPAHPRRTGTVDWEPNECGDEGKKQKRFISVTKMATLCVCQMGPLFWYYKAFYYGNMFRKSVKDDKDSEKRKFFSKMVEAERDATYLRFFEAFLESAPQLIIQGSIAANFFWNHFTDPQYPYWLYFQACSLLLSIISISWSVVVQNRSLRMIRDDKVNIWPHEAILQFCWRFLTILTRIITLCAYVLVFGVNVVALIFGHLLVTLVHVIFLQALHIEACSHIEKLLLLINTFIHIFTPFNMAEGNTRYRYFVAYTIEFAELLAIFVFLPASLTTFPFIEVVRWVVPIVFLIGISIMMTYYLFFHPNRRQLVVSQSQMDLTGEVDVESKISGKQSAGSTDEITINTVDTEIKPITKSPPEPITQVTNEVTDALLVEDCQN